MRIYLDNAATSWPKPETVYSAMDAYQREVGASAGRGAYRDAQLAQREVDGARRGCAQLLGADDPNQIVFGASATDMLNLAILGIVRPGDRIVTTEAEHNSVLRPLAALAESRGVEVIRVSCDASGYVDLEAWRAAFSRHARLAAFLHVSNVTGAVQPAAEMVKIARESGAFTLLDAAQSLGHMPLSVAELGVDLLASSGHKGMLGPAGTGLLWIRSGVERELSPLRYGGTGADSDAPIAPEELPWRFETGSHNVPALAGLAAACRWLADYGVDKIARHETELAESLHAGLAEIAGVTLHGPPAAAPRGGVVSFTVAGYDPQEFAAMLDASHGVQCRAGLHCAPRMHRALGTHAGGGTIRMSVGWHTTIEEIQAAVQAVAELAAPL